MILKLKKDMMFSDQNVTTIKIDWEIIKERISAKELEVLLESQMDSWL